MKTKISKILRIIPAILIVLSVLLPTPALGIADPDSQPQMNSVRVYHDLLGTGDLGVLITYSIPYAAIPADTADRAYLASFIAADGVTQLKSVAPYVFVDSGYNSGLMWIYFSATEVTTFGLTSTDQALYRIWLMGNPTLASGWSTTPPITVTTIDYWQPSGSSTPALVALQVLSDANILELAWSLSLLSSTTSGNKLTATGESYFLNVIPGLRLIAPSVFASGIEQPILLPQDYTTEFGATFTNGSGTAAGSPITLVEGNNTVNITGNGSFVINLTQGTVGTATDSVGVITGSPVSLSMGDNTIVTTGIGNIIVNVVLSNTQTGLIGGVTGTGFDVTPAATSFGMTRGLFGSLIWLILSIYLCSKARTTIGDKQTMFLFEICVIGGAVLGIMSLIVAALLAIGWGLLIAYVLFFRGSSA